MGCFGGSPSRQPCFSEKLRVIFENHFLCLFTLCFDELIYVVLLNGALMILYRNKKPPILLGSENAETVNGQWFYGAYLGLIVTRKRSNLQQKQFW